MRKRASVERGGRDAAFVIHTELLLASSIVVIAMLAPVIAQERITYFIDDHLGSPVVGLDASGAIVWRADYDPFGNLVSSTGTLSTNRRWLGAKYDPISDLLSLGQRHYDPNLGRFLTVDPAILGPPPQQTMTSPSRLNAYAYGLNNPLRFSDLDGADPAVATVRPEGYAYTKSTIVGRQPAGNLVQSVPHYAMRALQQSPSAFFPFDVVGATGEKGLARGKVFYLMARPGSPMPFPPGTNPVRVTELTETSFEFTTMPGHFDPEGSTIRFSIYTDPAGNVILRQESNAWSDSDLEQRPLLFNQLAATLGNIGWDIQAGQLRALLSTGRIPSPWPQRW